MTNPQSRRATTLCVKRVCVRLVGEDLSCRFSVYLAAISARRMEEAGKGRQKRKDGRVLRMYARNRQ